MQQYWWSAGCLGIACIIGLQLVHLPDGNLHLHVFDVGQGDAILLVSPTGKQVLIDGGPNLDILEHLEAHLPFFDRTLELVILTHPDADHITALPAVFSRYNVERVLMTGADHNSSRNRAFIESVLQNGSEVLLPDPMVDIDLGDGLVLDVVWPHTNLVGTLPSRPNDQSVVVRALYGAHSILLSGDIEAQAEAAIVASGLDIRSTILKVPHHGSRSSSSTGFLLAVSPELALVSAGRGNPFGHPHSDVINRYASFGIPVRSTSAEGTISLTLQ